MVTKRHLFFFLAVLLALGLPLLLRHKSPQGADDQKSLVEPTEAAPNPAPSAGDGRRRTRPSQDRGERATPLQWAARRVQAPPALCLIRGSVLTLEGEPLAGARIALAEENDTEGDLFDASPDSVLSGPKGKFEIQLASPFEGWLEVTAPGFSRILEPVRLYQGSVLQRVFRLQPATAVLSGRVVDGITGEPVAGALVKATVLHQSNPRVPMTPRSARSSQSGAFVLSDVPLGRVVLVAFSDGYFEDQRDLSLNQASKSDIKLRLVMGDVYALQVLSSAGAPVEKASVERPDQWVVRTDAEGRVSMPLIEELSRVSFKVRAAGFRSSAFEFSRDHLPASVVLEKAPVLSGQIVDSGGRPLQGAVLTFIGGAESTPAFLGTTESDLGGRFSKVVTEPPVREVRASKAGYVTQRFDYGPQGAPSSIRLAMRPVETALVGSVSQAGGEAAERLHLVLTNMETGYKYAHAFADTDGRFEVYDAPAGRYRLDIQGYSKNYTTFANASMEVLLERGKTAVLDIQLEEPVRLVGVPVPATRQSP